MAKFNKELLSKSGRLINDPLTTPNDVLTGLVLLHPHLALLNIGNTIVRRDYTSLEFTQVISGGATGHEPLYSGFVGKGFLTAAIQGDVFTAPPVCHIVNVMKELCHQNQTNTILAIIQNNSGDSFNFAVAAEKARKDGINVRVLAVTDDCSDSMPSKKTDQPRGLTGVLLVQKIAAALCEEGEKSLLEIYDYCEALELKTVILTMKPATAVVQNPCVCSKCFSSDPFVIGGGLHGESSRKTLKTFDSEEAAGKALVEISKNLTLNESSVYVLLINNFGASKLEEGVFTSDLIKLLFSENINIVRVYAGTFMSALDMRGFSVTIMKVNDEIVKYLDMPTDAPAWKPCNYPLDSKAPVTLQARIRLVKHPRIKPKGLLLTDRQANILLIVFQFACDALVSCERQLNIIDRELGDGDTGTRLKHAAEDFLVLLKDKKLELTCLYVVFKQLSEISETIGGTMGALYCIIFETTANVFANTNPFGDKEDIEELTGKTWLTCLMNVVYAIKSYTKCEENNNNMLAPLMACAEMVEEKLLKDMKDIDAFCCGIVAAEEAIERTKLAECRYPDPGAHSVGIWLRAAFEAVKFRCEF